MRVLTFALSLFVLAGTVQAQNEISINATADVAVPADEISFQITLNAQAPTPQEAYGIHQKREQVLIEQLKKHEISEEDIHFKPVSIRKSHNNNYPKGERQQVQTQQNVTLSLSDFDTYEQIQVTLIENGFDQFSGEFSSSKSKKAEEEALKKALKIARQKANIIASETGLTISGIKNVNYNYDHSPSPSIAMRSQSTASLIEEYDQSVSISARISVTYNFDE
ncbi:putative conserved protein YggE, contains kinase-interacting SIMPL domain [Fodinibius salinus]|uniref:Putative conserved protein YggE, contains kinase-interacting SIMPL domain n=1 Tax=Fodinibius salinus TaxID=860790 RepID=A0A5D3YMY3_9BACT|nr:SIMPL domain-containing protein [Fodinibius salinus]TYP95545.1 putative conserved protein YggE, contains kinase-interacting SIMPL domain [Fodinibius salinus]